jgi:hypothetical protein
MLSIDHVRELLKDPSLTDKEIEEIRDACRALAELMFDAWRRKKLTQTRDNDQTS